MLNTMIIALAAAVAQGSASSSVDAKDVYGFWETENGATVEVERCGDSPCGFIRYVDTDQLEPEAREIALLDYRNPDESARDEPVIGLKMLGDYQANGTKGWNKGFVYDPEAGKEYKSTLSRTGPNELAMKGCVAFICREQTWTRTEMTEAKRAEAATLLPGGGKPTAAEAGITRDPRAN